MGRRKTRMEKLYIRKRLKGKMLSPVRSIPTEAFPTGRPFHVTTAWNVKGPLWSLKRHTGQDFTCPEGMPVYSVSWGRVVYAGMFGGWSSKGTYGNHIIIRTADGKYDYAACHLDTMRVKTGDRVLPGTLIGYSGSTGHVTGPHVHFEARLAGGGFGHDVDPRRVRRKHSTA